MRVVVVTHFASPYQVELFNSIEASNQIKLEVIYLHRTHATRDWATPSFLHPALALDEGPSRFQKAQGQISDADLVVFNYYAERPARLLLNGRAIIKQPWCFWGERPGSLRPEWLGRLRRRLILGKLHDSAAPIWGIGHFAVEGYKKEFGNSRIYDNIPYFSDLDRFRCADLNRRHGNHERVLLFSGSLTGRKGVDLLSRAFLRLSREHPHVRLILLGEGALREQVFRCLQPVRDRVEFVGFKDWGELPAFYARADVLCVPSRYDGWGLVVTEGLAAGLPVIGTNRTGAAIEFVENGRNGWLIPAGDENALFTAMRDAALLAHENLAQMSGNARRSVAEHSLQNGAMRFIRAAKDAVANWQS